MNRHLSSPTNVVACLALLVAATAVAQSPPPCAKHAERIKAFCIDFNWVGGRFAAPGTFAHADPKVHFQWYKDLGVNVIHTFCVSCDGYAWYRESSVAPVEPGLKHDFLKEITALAHKDGIKVMGYFCVGANALWAQKHPDQTYGGQGISIPLTTEYLDYLTASMKDVLLKTGIDGFQLDWMFSPPLLSEEKNVRWMACEQKMYQELFGRPFPGKDKIDARETEEFQRRALARCWRRIRETAKSTRPDCIVWLSCYNLKSPQVVGSKMLQEADWLVNEHPDPAYIEAVRKQIGPKTKIIQCLCGWMENDPNQVVGKLKDLDVGFYGFAMGDPQTTLPKPQSAARPGSLSSINARNIEQLRTIYHQKS
jgi:uncharacterized lipoprotein YddW (UPF0748 family)